MVYQAFRAGGLTAIGDPDAAPRGLATAVDVRGSGCRGWGV